MSYIKFLIIRLRNSSFSEMIYRGRQFFFLSRIRRRFYKGKIVFNDSLILSVDLDFLQLPTFQGRVDESLRDLLNFGNIITIKSEKDGFRQIDAATRGQFCCDSTSTRGIKDVRTIWEFSRLQHLSILLIAVNNDPGRKYAENIKKLVKDSLFSWLNKNPFLTGPNYLSAMECGLRIPVFFYALKILDNLGDDAKNHLLKVICQHAWWIFHRLSLYSSLGNHTVCESIGIVFAGAIFNSTPEGKVWLNRGIELLEQELLHQILDDGGPAEQSLNYHRFVLDLYWLAVDLLEKNRIHDCTEWKLRLLRGENFLISFCDDYGNLPAIGDSDDGHAIAPGIHPLRDTLVEPQKILPEGQLERPRESEASGRLNRNCSWDQPKYELTWKTSPETGYTVIRTPFGIFFTFDHGPLGMPPLYGHGHADALAVSLSVIGRPILVDPGTYRYNGAPEFRRYFKGTRAHNTITVDGKDQAEQETSFIWSHPFASQLFRTNRNSDGLILEASHNGYKRLTKPVEHHRTVFFFGGSYFLIRDTFFGTGIHDFELNYHLHPQAAIDSVDSRWWVIRHGEAEVYLGLLSGSKFNLIIGQETPPFGWFSPAYGIKLESGVLTSIQRGDVRGTSFLTAICVGSPGEENFLLEMGNML